MNLIQAFKAFCHVLKGVELVPKEEALPAPAPPPVVPEPAPEPINDRFEEGAIYTLLLLQREGSLVDFLQGPIEGFEDKQIADVVRVVHANCAKVLKENFGLESVRSEEELSMVTIEEGFDPSAIKLSGSLPANGPYTGELVHRGWRAANVHFAKRGGTYDPSVVHAAEVEIN